MSGLIVIFGGIVLAFGIGALIMDYVQKQKFKIPHNKKTA